MYRSALTVLAGRCKMRCPWTNCAHSSGDYSSQIAINPTDGLGSTRDVTFFQASLSRVVDVSAVDALFCLSVQSTESRSSLHHLSNIPQTSLLRTLILVDDQARRHYPNGKDQEHCYHRSWFVFHTTEHFTPLMHPQLIMEKRLSLTSFSANPVPFVGLLPPNSYR